MFLGIEPPDLHLFRTTSRITPRSRPISNGQIQPCGELKRPLRQDHYRHWSEVSLHFPPSIQTLKATKPILLLSTGIGYSTVKHLANRGAKVYLGSRTEQRGKEAVEKLKGAGIAKGDVVFLPCDLGSPASAKKAAEDFLQLENRLDVLGMFSSPYIL